MYDEEDSYVPSERFRPQYSVDLTDMEVLRLVHIGHASRKGVIDTGQPKISSVLETKKLVSRVTNHNGREGWKITDLGIAALKERSSELKRL